MIKEKKTLNEVTIQHIKKSLKSASQKSVITLINACMGYNNKIHYIEGLEYLVKFIVKAVHDESLAFAFMIGFIERLELDNVKLRIYQLNRLLYTYLPNLVEHFKLLDIDIMTFCVRIVFGLFKGTDTNFLMQMLTHTLSFSWKTLFTLTLNLLKRNQGHLLSLNSKEVLQFVLDTVWKEDVKVSNWVLEELELEYDEIVNNELC